MLKLIARLAILVIGRDLARAIYRNVVYGEKNSVGIVGIALTPMMRLLIAMPRLAPVASALREGGTGQVVHYSWSSINQSVSSVLELPDVAITSGRKKTVNVLVPAFSFSTMSAGFFGVFQVALMIARNGHHVRLVLFDKFTFSYSQFKAQLANHPGLQTLLDEVEVEHIDEGGCLYISKDDVVAATVWYSAYFARKISYILGGRPFIYLIQDYEAAFFPASSLYSLADATYGFNYNALVSTKPLYEFMRTHCAHFESLVKAGRAVWFNNACAADLPDKKKFVAAKGLPVRRLAFYCRPAVNRNMFELGAASLIKAWEAGVFRGCEVWEMYGIGIGNVEIELADGVTLKQLPRMSLAEYERSIINFDICLSLMASPHPSIPPFDLAGVGAIVVTNSYACKGPEYFDAISRNILCVDPTVEAIVGGLEKAVARSGNLEERWENARTLAYPRQWSDTWQEEHARFIDKSCGSPLVGQDAEVRSGELFKA